MQHIKNGAFTLFAGLAMAFAGASCSDEPDAGQSATTHKWDIAGNEIVNIKPERQKLLRNPMSGWVIYTGIGDGLSDTFWEEYDHFPSAVGPVKVSDYGNTLFIRGAWSDFNPEEGKYIWNEGQVDSKPARRFKMLVDGAKARGLKLAFSFVCDSQDKHYNFTPDYVKQAGAKGFETKTGVSTIVWSPFADDPVFQKYYEKFIQDLAAKYDDPDVTMFISGTGLGKWGETHTMRYSTGDNTPRRAVAEWVSDVYTRNFKRVPLLINYHRTLLSTGAFTDNPSQETADIIDMFVEKGYSLRHDAFGMKQYYKDWERGIAQLYRYRRPLVMEGGWVESSHGGSIKGDGYADHGEVRWGEFYEGKQACVNMMDFRYSKTAGETYRWFNDAYEAVNEFIAEGAYRLYPDKVSVPVSASAGGNVTLTHRWSNLGWGYCPTNIPQWNQKYKVGFALLDKTTDKPVAVYVDEVPCIDKWLKGKPSTYTVTFNLGTVAAGEYIWAVGLVDTTKNNEIGLEISAKDNVTADGWLKLHAVSVH